MRATQKSGNRQSRTTHKPKKSCPKLDPCIFDAEVSDLKDSSCLPSNLSRSQLPDRGNLASLSQTYILNHKAYLLQRADVSAVHTGWALMVINLRRIDFKILFPYTTCETKSKQLRLQAENVTELPLSKAQLRDL